MLFNSLQFALFLLAVWAVFGSLPVRTRPALLLAASLLFYSFWIPAYLLLLAATILVNWVLMRRMVSSDRPRLWLIVALTYTLSLLAVFKYAGFLIANAAPLLRLSFGWEPPALEILLPLGISFYSFQIIALTVDVYRGRIARPETLSRYALFICFFPQLIAGPIVRGYELLPQFERNGGQTPTRTRRGLWLLWSGVVKKVLFADFLLAPFVDPVFAEPGARHAPYQLIAVYSFAFQIYFDFSGYTDMARGMALLLGFELPHNFKEPYLARNPIEFWRCWHITLSTWLRDYVYIPLGGNRRGRLHTVVNLALTMLLGGLWHGASWNFIVWGGLHGVILIVHRVWSRSSRGSEDPFQGWDWLRALLLFHFICLLWVFFRAATLSDAGAVLDTLFRGDYGADWPLFQMAVIVLCVAAHVVERWLRRNAASLQRFCAENVWGPALEGSILGGTAALALLTGSGAHEFIYFQF